jgi:hypothetical protein
MQLPLELVDIVASSLSRTDLAAFALVSSHTLPVAQRHLYRRLSLSPAFRNLFLVLQLAKKPVLARHVRSFTVSLPPMFFHAFYRQLAKALAHMNALTSLDLFIPPNLSWILSSVHPQSLLHFACSFRFDCHVAEFLEKTNALLELEIDDVSPRLNSFCLPNLSHFVGSCCAAQTLVPGRPVQTIHLTSDLTHEAVQCFSRSTANVSVLNATTNLPPIPILQSLADNLPTLVYLRVIATFDFTQAPDVVSLKTPSCCFSLREVFLRKRSASIGRAIKFISIRILWHVLGPPAWRGRKTSLEIATGREPHRKRQRAT